MRTRVGYTGGKKASPTYRRMGDHAETIEIDFDPEQISYDTLLDIFWMSHRPTRRPWSRQYMSAIFTRSPKQIALAEASKVTQAEAHGQIFTEIVSASTFYLAENYHQKYMLRQAHDLMAEYEIIFPNVADFINSTSAARANGYVNGYVDIATMEADLPHLGLSSKSQQSLLKMAKRYN